MKHHPAIQTALIAFTFLFFMACNGKKNDSDHLKIIISDEHDIPTAARIRITTLDQQYLAPEGHTHDFPMTTSEDQEPVETDIVLDEQRRFAYVDGTCFLNSGSDSIRVEVVKGFNYSIHDEIYSIRNREPIEIKLKRAFESLPDQNWYSGDVHVHHINKESALLEMKAEDVNVCNLLISDFTLDHEHFRGTIEPESDPLHLLFYGQEYREDRLGHMTY